MLVNHMHVRSDAAGWPQMQKDGESGGPVPVHGFELLWQSIRCDLSAQSDI